MLRAYPRAAGRGRGKRRRVSPASPSPAAASARTDPGSGTGTGENATPRKAVFAGAVERTVNGVKLVPRSVNVTSRLADASVVVAYRIGFGPLKSATRPRAPPAVPVPSVSVVVNVHAVPL